MSPWRVDEVPVEEGDNSGARVASGRLVVAGGGKLTGQRAFGIRGKAAIVDARDGERMVGCEHQREAAARDLVDPYADGPDRA
jgi:hypothetical protein